MAGADLAAGATRLSAGGFGPGDLLLVLLFAVTLPWSVIGFWNATIGFIIMRFARDPVAAVTPAAGARHRATSRSSSSTAILVCIRNEPPERVIRHIAPMIDGLIARGVAPALPSLCAERHLRPRARRDREPACSPSSPTPGAAASALTYRRREHQHRLQGRQHPRLLRALGQAARLRAGARRRQPDDRRRGAAPGAHHAGQSAARHPAEPGHRHAVDQRVRAHLPVRHAARHALLHHRQRLVAGRLRPLLGPQRHRADRAVHGALPPAGAAARARSSPAMCSATTRSRRC